MADIYSKFVAPNLPQSWADWLHPYSAYIDSATIIVAGAIVIGAILYTYYEVDRELTRDPRVTRQLKEMYRRSGELLKRQIANDKELLTFQADCRIWHAETRQIISSKMEPATMTRFLHFEMTLPYDHGSTFGGDHQKLLNGLNRYHRNLQAIIDSQEWR